MAAPPIPLPSPRVAIRTGLAPHYGPGAPEAIRVALSELCRSLDWMDEDGSPMGRLVPEGAQVVVKPNWVLHANQGPWGLEPLITHQLLIQAVTEAVLKARAGQVVVADAPIQGCDFDALQSATGLLEWAASLRTRDSRFAGVLDLRRTIRTQEEGQESTREGVRPPELFTLFDLETDSLLDAITSPEPKFRVTQYHPEYLGMTHAPGKHQFLVAREVVEADLVINLPKLKTHKKAGITCALKNLVGINGNKEYLPHHRIGSPAEGGDCYPESSRIKRALEWSFDRFNSSTSHLARGSWQQVARVLQAIQHRRGDQIGIEGSWSGNDTVWRMCLDLNRILLYGGAAGTFAETPRRRVVQVVDAIMAGQGDGPLRSAPLPLGILLAGESAAAVDWIAAQLLGYDPSLIPIARHAFDEFRWPLTAFDAAAVVVVDAATGQVVTHEALAALTPTGVSYPAGWLDAVRAPR